MSPTREVEHLPELSPVPPNLQQLTLRVVIYVEGDFQPTHCVSYLPAAIKAINTFASSVRHLTIELDLGVGCLPSYLALVDFSPLAALGALSIPRIDLYVHTDTRPPAVTLASLLSSLAPYDDVMKLIEEGKLVIHPEETAPDYLREEYLTLRDLLRSHKNVINS